MTAEYNDKIRNMSAENQHTAGYEDGMERATQMEYEIKQIIAYHLDLTSTQYANGYFEGAKFVLNKFLKDYYV